MSFIGVRGLVVAVAAGILIGPLQPVLAQSQPTPTPNQNGIRLTTSPLPLSLTALPGTTVSVNLKVKNSGTQTEILKAGLLTFTAKGSSGSPQLRDRGPGDDFFDWVSFSPETFTAVPNVWQTITMTITIPKTAAFGYYYAVTFSRAHPAKPANLEAAIVGATATLVLLDVEAPGAKREVTIQDFRPSHAWYEFLPAHFTVTLHNSGNVHAAPSGTIYITRGPTISPTLAQLPVNAAKGNILPNSYRDFTASWTDGFPNYVTTASHNHATQHLSWDITKADHLRFGKYTAHLVMAYDNGMRDVPLEATTTFWVIPWRLIFGVVVVLLILGIGVYALGRFMTRLITKRFQRRP